MIDIKLKEVLEEKIVIEKIVEEKIVIEIKMITN
jgi:hypothetical protein